MTDAKKGEEKKQGPIEKNPKREARRIANERDGGGLIG
jgi:hypothetical protein